MLKDLTVAKVKIGTMFKLKHHRGVFVKVEYPSVYYQDSQVYHVDKQITEIIENH